MTTPQVNPVGVPSQLALKTKSQKENLPSFSETLKPLEQKGKGEKSEVKLTVSENKSLKNDGLKEKTVDSMPNEKADLKEGSLEKKEAEPVLANKISDSDKMTEEKNAYAKNLNLLTEEENTDTDVLMSLLVNFIKDLSLQIGAKEEEVKEFLIQNGVEVNELLDMNTWKKFTLERNGLTDMSEILTSDKAFGELNMISGFLEKMVNFSEMRQLTTRLTEGSLKFEEIFREFEEMIPEFEKEKTEEVTAFSSPNEVTEGKEEENLSLLKDGEFGNPDSKSDLKENSREGITLSRNQNVLTPIGNRLFDNLVSSISKLEGSARLPEGLSAGDIISQVTEQIKTLHAPDKTTIELMLQPATLGKVLINVTSKNGIMQAELRVENPEAKQALMNNIADLKLNFENQGFKVEEIEIMLAETGIGEKDRERGQGEEEKKNKGKSRKIDFLEEDTAEGLSDVNERLSVDSSMGSSVDYTA